MMEIWRLNSILFFFVPGQLEETDQVVALLRGFNQVVRKEKYKEGWMLVLIHPALSNQFSIHHKMDDIELEIKKIVVSGPWLSTTVSSTRTLRSYRKSFLFGARHKLQGSFSKETITSEFAVYQPKLLMNYKAKLTR